MTIHVRTTKGTIQVSAAKISQLRKQGKLNESARCISLDRGMSWLTYRELVAKVRRRHLAAKVTKETTPLPPHSESEESVAEEVLLTEAPRKASSEPDGLTKVHEEQAGTSNRVTDEKKRQSPVKLASRMRFAQCIDSVKAWVLARHTYSTAFIQALCFAYALAFAPLLGFYWQQKNDQISGSTEVSAWVVVGIFAAWGLSFFIGGFWGYCVDECIYHREGRKLPSERPPNLPLALIIVVGLLGGGVLGVLYMSQASPGSAYAFFVAYFIAFIAGPGVPSTAYALSLDLHLHFNPTRKLEHHNPAVRMSGLKHVTDERMLCEVALHTYLPTERNEGIDITNNRYHKVDLEAVRRITTPEILVRIIESSEKLHIRSAAIDQLLDIQVLETIANSIGNEEVRCKARERIDELKKARAVPIEPRHEPIAAEVEMDPASPAAETQAHPPAMPETITYESSALELRNAAEWNVGDLVAGLYEVLPVATRQRKGVTEAAFHKGGMGRVYRVRHRTWQRDLAVKCPRPELSWDKTVASSFIKECESWMELGLHPHIVSCFYVKHLDGLLRVFAEYVDGGSLSDWIKTKRLYEDGPTAALARILDIAIQFAWGLHFAHEKGVIHQDVKPHNLMLTADGKAKVSDFGLARAKEVLGLNSKSADGGTIMVTHSGGYTPAYCSPEQKHSGHLTRRSDIWSWGLSVLEMFAGEVTWRSGTSALEALGEYIDVPRSVERPDMTDGIVALLRECFQRDEAARPRTMLECADTLVAIYEREVCKTYPRTMPEELRLRADGCNNRGVSHYELGRTEDAVKAFTEALNDAPNHVEATFNLALLQWRSGRIDDLEAVRRIEEAKRNDPTGRRAAYFAGLIHLERDDIDRALVEFRACREASDSHEIQAAIRVAESLQPNASRLLDMFSDPLKMGIPMPLTSIAVSPRGRVVLSDSEEGIMKLWDFDSGECYRQLSGHWAAVTSVAIRGDGYIALSGSRDRTLRLWDLSTGDCLNVLEGHLDTINSVAFSLDGQMAASASLDGTVRLWDVMTGRCLKTLEGHKGCVYCVTFSPDGRSVLSGDNNGDLKLWDVSTGACERTCTGHVAAVTSAAISPDGRFALSGSADRSIRIWDLNSGQCIRVLNGHGKWVTAVKICNGGRIAVSGSYDNTVRVWNLATGQCLRTLESHAQSVYCVDVSHDGHYAASCGKDRRIMIWKIAPFLSDRLAPQLSVAAVEESEKRSRLDAEYSSRLAEVSQIDNDDVAARLIAIAKIRDIPGREFAPEILEMWNEAGRYCQRRGLRSAWISNSFEQGPLEDVDYCAISPDGRLALSGCIEEKKLYVWDIVSGKLLHEIGGKGSRVLHAVFGVNSQSIVCANDDYSITLMRCDTRQCLQTFDGHEDPVRSIFVTPNGRYIISRSDEQAIRIWDVASAECVRTIDDLKETIGCAAMSPDGGLLLTGGSCGAIRLWDLATGDCVRTLWEEVDRWEKPTVAVIDVACSPDGTSILSFKKNGVVERWDPASGKRLYSTADAKSSLSIPQLRSAAISFDGRFVAAVNENRTVSMCEVEMLKVIRELDGHKQGVNCLAFTPNGRRLLSGGDDGSLLLWELDWEFEFPGWANWDEGARPYLEYFLALHSTIDDNHTTRFGTDQWTEGEVETLMNTLQCGGYGWLRPEGVLFKLRECLTEYS